MLGRSNRKSDPRGQPQKAFFAEIGSLNDISDRAVAIDEDAVADIHEFLSIRRYQQNGAACFGKFDPDALDFCACTDIHTSRWIDQQEDLRARSQPAGNLDLLLVATAQRVDQRVD